MKYKILKHEVTGKKGQSFFKGQVIDESKFVEGSIDHLKAIGSIEACMEAPAEVKVKKSKESTKTDE